MLTPDQAERGLRAFAKVAERCDQIDPVGAQALRDLTIGRPWWTYLLPFAVYRRLVLSRYRIADHEKSPASES